MSLTVAVWQMEILLLVVNKKPTLGFCLAIYLITYLLYEIQCCLTS